MDNRERYWMCGSCKCKFKEKGDLIKHLERNSEILSVIENPRLKKRIREEMMVHQHK